MLVSPANVRGEIVWQASMDSVNWYDISEAAGHDGIKDNDISFEENRIRVSFSRSALVAILMKNPNFLEGIARVISGEGAGVAECEECGEGLS